MGNVRDSYFEAKGQIREAKSKKLNPTLRESLDSEVLPIVLQHLEELRLLLESGYQKEGLTKTVGLIDMLSRYLGR